MAAPNFQLVTELQTVTRRDFPLADPTLLNPTSTTPVVDGEFLELQQNAAGAQVLDRTAAAGQKILTFPLHTERGRYDTQAIGKATILMLGMYEADTKLYSTGGGGVATLGMALRVVTASNRRVIEGVAAPALTDVIVGYVTKVAANGKVRFVHFANTFGVGI